MRLIHGFNMMDGYGVNMKCRGISWKMNDDPWHDVRFYFHGFGKDELWLIKYETRMKDGY